MLSALTVWVLALLTGCQTTPAPALAPCPWPAAEQVTKLLAIVPLGTPREEVLKRLKDAGVLGNFGENQSIYYCDIWERGEGLRWHINVVLLFDEAGRLYATQPELPGQRAAIADPTAAALNGSPTVGDHSPAAHIAGATEAGPSPSLPTSGLRAGAARPTASASSRPAAATASSLPTNSVPVGVEVPNRVADPFGP